MALPRPYNVSASGNRENRYWTSSQPKRIDSQKPSASWVFIFLSQGSRIWRSGWVGLDCLLAVFSLAEMALGGHCTLLAARQVSNATPV